MTSGQRDRLRLLLTSLRSVFAGMLRRTTEGAVEMANSAFSRCPPSSDLDPEIRISHLGKVDGDSFWLVYLFLIIGQSVTNH